MSEEAKKSPDYLLLLAPELREMVEKQIEIDDEKINWEKADIFSVGLIALMLMNPQACIGNNLLNQTKGKAEKILEEIQKSKAYDDWLCLFVGKMLIWEISSRLDKTQAFEEIYKYKKENISAIKEKEKELDSKLQELEQTRKTLEEEKKIVAKDFSTQLKSMEEVRWHSQNKDSFYSSIRSIL